MRFEKSTLQIAAKKSKIKNSEYKLTLNYVANVVSAIKIIA